jgi:hypothetical protein
MRVPERRGFGDGLVGGLVDADDHNVMGQRRRCVGAQPAHLGIIERLVGEAQRARSHQSPGGGADQQETEQEIA